MAAAASRREGAFTSLFLDGRRPYSQGGKRDSSFRRRPGSVTAPARFFLLRDGLQSSRTQQDCVGRNPAVRLQIFFSKKGTNNDIALAEGGIGARVALAQPCPQPPRALSTHASEDVNTLTAGGKMHEGEGNHASEKTLIQRAFPNQ